MSSKLKSIVFRVENPAKLAKWYEENVGSLTVSENSSTWLCQFKDESVQIKLLQGSGASYQSCRSSVYWKIGLALPNVTLARNELVKKGISVSKPAQFMDIGFLCHLNDPEGYSIELLQHTFEDNFVEPPVQEGKILGQEKWIGQITLRCSQIDQTLNFYQNILGMKMLSIQKVGAYGFTLYFLAFTDEDPPEQDLNSVKIREWLWQRPYTTLELQHVAGSNFEGMKENDLGVDSIEMTIANHDEVLQKLNNAGYKTNEVGNGYRVCDPDGAKIMILKN